MSLFYEFDGFVYQVQDDFHHVILSLAKHSVLFEPLASENIKYGPCALVKIPRVLLYIADLVLFQKDASRRKPLLHPLQSLQQYLFALPRLEYQPQETPP